MKRGNAGRSAPTAPSNSNQRLNTAMNATNEAARANLAKGLANPEMRAQKVNQMYDKQFGGHGNSRHGAQTTTQQHNQRVLTGAQPDGGGGYAPRTSSHWNSQQSQLAARHAAQNEFQNNRRFGQAQPSQSNGNLVFTPSMGNQVTGASSTRLGSAKNPTGVSNTQTIGAKVVLRPGGRYLTDYPE